MGEQTTVPLAIAARAPSQRRPSRFADLVPEIQREQYRRLGGMGLVYAGAWITNFAYYQLTPHAYESNARLAFWYATTFACAAFGVGVYLLCRKQRIPVHRFAGFAVAFEVVGGLGIMTGSFGWEHMGADFLGKVAAALGIGAGDILPRIVEPLERERLRLLYIDGVGWVSVWLLAFPLVVPMQTAGTVLATLLTAATVPVMLGLSLLANGTPPVVRTWILPYFLEATIPTFICAGIAVFGSRIVYRLTRELSQARRLGSYRLVEKIGAGGMGEVWKAKHRLLARPAAVKLIRAEALRSPQGASGTALQRFEREAQATANLSSPHTVEIYDFGVTETGVFYYVMELLTGMDLRTLVERFGPLPAERVVHILVQACHSLADAHATGLVHRDVKPANLFVCRRGQDHDFVKVLDFGLVKHLGEIEPGSPQITIEGFASGTPEFMAPEMALDRRAVDERADLYALGCVAYWLLCGQLVFEGGTPTAILVQHAKDPPPPPSSRTELEIPAALESLVLQCLEKRPEARPQSAHELGQRLAACSTSLPAWSAERAAHWWRAHLPELAATHEPPPTGSL